MDQRGHHPVLRHPASGRLRALTGSLARRRAVRRSLWRPHRRCVLRRIDVLQLPARLESRARETGRPLARGRLHFARHLMGHSAPRRIWRKGDPQGGISRASPVQHRPRRGVPGATRDCTVPNYLVIRQHANAEQVARGHGELRLGNPHRRPPRGHPPFPDVSHRLHPEAHHPRHSPLGCQGSGRSKAT